MRVKVLTTSTDTPGAEFEIINHIFHKVGALMMSCPFCSSELEIVKENPLAYAIFDKYPVNKGHILIIPKRHVSDYFETTNEEKLAMQELLEGCKEMLDESYNPDGYNVGINCGETAGQTIFHVHMHLIPRLKGDMDDPRGGVRGVIPEKRVY